LPSYVGMAVTFLVVAIASGYIRARRASAINPMEGLRSNCSGKHNARTSSIGNLTGQFDTTKKCLKTRVGAEAIQPQVGVDVPGGVQGFFLKRLFQEL
jgi:hypothetical protein